MKNIVIRKTEESNEWLAEELFKYNYKLNQDKD